MRMKLLFLFCVVFVVGVAPENHDYYDDSDMFMEPLDDGLPLSSNVQPQIVAHNQPDEAQIEYNANTTNKENGRDNQDSAKHDLGPLVTVLKPQEIINSKLEDKFQEKDDSNSSKNNEEPLDDVSIEEDLRTSPKDPKLNKEGTDDAINEEAQPIVAVLPTDLQGRDTRSWYPSFGNWQQPPLGHSRPFYNSKHQQEGAYSQRSDPPFQQEIAYVPPQKFLDLRGYKDQFRGGSAQQQVQSDASVDILGDGNFGVIQGGTFYPEKDSYDAESSDHFDDFSYFGPNNGHGRPSSFYYGGKPNPKPYTHKQFENFRDFAEINAGVAPERQYSHYVIVYSNKNATKDPHNDENYSNTNIAKTKPKNIIEQLTMLDLETQKTNSEEEELRQKKLSKSKRKLALIMPEKKHKARLLKKERDMQSEPLLALS